MKPVFFFFTLFLSLCALSQTTDLLHHEKFLVVLAHPDDETWLNGTLALLASHKKQIRVLYATSGGAGNDYSSQGLSGERLALAREAECTSAHQALGMSSPPIFLRHGDQHLKHHKKSLKENILRNITTFKPDAILTFDQHGITGHKDHKLVSRITTQLHKDLTNIKLYKVVISKSRTEVLHRLAKSLGHPYRIKHPVEDSKVSIRVDVQEFSEARINAFAQYPTQFPSSLQILWKTFVHSSDQEEFIF